MFILALRQDGISVAALEAGFLGPESVTEEGSASYHLRGQCIHHICDWYMEGEKALILFF